MLTNSVKHAVTRVVAFGLIGTLAIPLDAIAQAQARQTTQVERVGVNADDELMLTLEDAIGFALLNNKDISAARIDVEIAEHDLSSAKGVYDPKVTAETYAERHEVPIASIIGGSSSGKLTTSDLGGKVGLGGSTVAGATYQVDLNAARQTTDNTFTSINPQYPAGLTATYTQPLGKGLKTDDNRRRIEIAKRNLDLTDAQFRQRAMETITRVQQAYWDLVFALKNQEVQSDAVRQGRTQVESNRRQVDQGTLAPIDIVSAEVQVTIFEQNLYQAQEAVTRAENSLKQLMLSHRTDAVWSRVLVPTTTAELKVPMIELSNAVTEALASRPELDQVAEARQINAINQKYLGNQLKPQIDLVGTFTLSGVAGSPVLQGPNAFTAGTILLTERVNDLSQLQGLAPLPAAASSFGSVPQALVGSAGQSLTNLFGFNYPSARVGLKFTFPRGNHTAEANVGRAAAEARKIENQREQLEQVIEADVRNSLQALRSAEARLSSAVASRTAAEEQSESEQRKFQSGLSTTFLVLQRQQELINTRGREVQAQTDLNKAIAEFERATGSTFKSHNIIVHPDKGGPQIQQGR